MDGQVLLPDEVAAQLRCSRRQVYDLFKEGELHGFHVGMSIKIFAGSVRNYIDRHSNQPPPVNKQGPLLAAESTPIKPPPRPRAGSRPSQAPPVGYRHLRPGPRMAW
jgi:excisionase family DNA binding protein